MSEKEKDELFNVWVLRLIKRLTGVLCALVVLISCFGNSTVCYADELSGRASDSNIVTYLGRVGLLDYFESRGFVYNENHKYFLGSSKEATLDYYSYKIFLYEYYLDEGFEPRVYMTSYGYSTGKSNCNGREYTLGIRLKDGGIVDYPVSDITPTSKGLTNGFGFDSFYHSVLYYSDFGVCASETDDTVILNPTSWSRVCFIPNGDKYFDIGSSDVYNSDIGYLKDLSITQVGAGTNIDTGEKAIKYEFGFSPFSTRGIDITTGDYVIRLYGELAYYNANSGLDLSYSEIDNIVYVEDLTISDSSVWVDYTALCNAVSANSDLMSESEMAISNAVRSDKLYFQIYNTVTGEYGGYVCFTNTSRTIGKGDTIVTVTPDGETDPDGYIENPSNGSTGDAGNDTDKEITDVWEGFGEFQSILEGFANATESISRVFDTLFSFLPSWCRQLFGLSIGACCFIIVAKFLRG